MSGSADQDVLVFLRGRFGRLEPDVTGRRAA
jgi:hypothetical protein